MTVTLPAPSIADRAEPSRCRDVQRRGERPARRAHGRLHLDAVVDVVFPHDDRVTGVVHRNLRMDRRRA